MKVLALAFSFLLSAEVATATEAEIAAVPQRFLDDASYYGGSGQVFPCYGDVVEFETSVMVDFDGFDEDPGDVTRIDWQGLELLFMDSYNVLSKDLCDDAFREVVYVTVERDAEGSKIIKRGGDMYSVRFTVQVRCRGCYPDSAFLFSGPGSYARALTGHKAKGHEDENVNEYQEAIIGEDGSIADGGHRAHRALKSSKSSGSYSGSYSKSSKASKSTKSSKSSGKGKGKGGGGGGGGGDDDDGGGGGGGGDDYCRCDSRYPEWRPPTEEEFRVVYDAAIKEVKTGYIPPRRGGVSVDFVAKVTETVDLECSEEIEEFSSLVSVEFFGNPVDVTEEERNVLEENFVQTYNGLQANRCDDPFFRKATIADIVMQADPKEANVFMYVFRVDGTCRGLGCSSNFTFFDEPMSPESRKLHYDPEEGWEHARPETGCSCPLYATEYGAPSADDFAVRLFVVVQDLKTRGQLPNVDASGEVFELPYGFTASPTSTPGSGIPTSTPGGVTPTLPPVATTAPTPGLITTAPTPAIQGTESPSGSPVAAGATPSPTTGRGGITASPTTSPTVDFNATDAPTPAVVAPTPGTPAPSIPATPSPTPGVGTPAPTSFNATDGPTTSPTPLTGAETPAPSGNATEATPEPTGGNITDTTPSPSTQGTPAPSSNATELTPEPTAGNATDLTPSPTPASTNSSETPAPTTLETLAPSPLSNVTSPDTASPTSFSTDNNTAAENSTQA